MVKTNNEQKQNILINQTLKQQKPFCKTCKPYFSNKHSHVGSKITLIENNRIVSENRKIAKTLTYFESVAYSLNLFEWIGESGNSNDKI